MSTLVMQMMTGGIVLLGLCTSVASDCTWNGDSDYTKYAPGAEVKLHSDTTKKMPNNGEESAWEAWGISLVVPVACLFCFCGCCLGCFMCRYNCIMNKRLDTPGKLVPSEKWSAGGSRRSCGWAFVAITLFVSAFTLSYGMVERDKFVNEIRTIPDILRVYSAFIRDDVIPELECVANDTTAVINASTSLASCANSASVDNTVTQITDAANTILSNTGIDSATGIFKDLADGIDNVAANARMDKEADDTRAVINVFVGIAAVIILVNFVLGYCAAKNDGWKEKTAMICCASECMCTCFFAFVVIVCVSLVLLRAVASFCIDPDRLMAEIDQANIGEQSRYYLVCDSYSEQDKITKYPFYAERNTTSAAYGQIVQFTGTLGQNPAVQTAACQPLFTALNASVASLADDFTGPAGVFGPLGPLGCSLTARFVEAIFILVCDTLYVPLDRMVWCLAVAAAIMAILTFVNACMRRENGAKHQQFNNMNAAFDGDGTVPMTVLRDYSTQGGAAPIVNPAMVIDPPAYREPKDQNRSINVVPGHAAWEDDEHQKSAYEDDGEREMMA